MTAGFNLNFSTSEKPESRNPRAVDRRMQGLIDHTVKEWQRVDSFLKQYDSAEEQARLAEACKVVGTAVWGLLPLINYDGRLPAISGLYAFRLWMREFYFDAGAPKPQIAMCVCAEYLAAYFERNTGDPHWDEVAEIVFKSFGCYPSSEYKKNSGRWLKKKLSQFQRWWKTGVPQKGKPSRLPFLEKTSSAMWQPQEYYRKRNERNREFHELNGALENLLHRAADKLNKLVEAGRKRGEWLCKSVSKRERIRAVNAVMKTPEMQRLKRQIQQAREKLAEFHKRCAEENERERQRDSARSQYRWMRTYTALRKKEKRNRTIHRLTMSHQSKNWKTTS